MSIFARREIQERLNSFAKVVKKRKLNQIVRDLNIEGNKSNSKRFLESLAATWEVVIVSAFSELGNTKYEMQISNGKRPDFFFSDRGVSLIGDIVTVSDDQQHKKNPVDDFSTIIRKLWKDFSLQKGSLSWRLEGVDLKPPPAPKTTGFWGPFHLSSRLRPISRGSLKRLALPPSSQLSKYLYDKVSPFFKELRASPDIPHSLRIDEQYDQKTTVRFSIKYSPKGIGLTGMYPSYTTITDIERHVLWRRLIEKKEQFAHATEDLPRILIVCDGGCAALSDSFGGGLSEYRLEEVLDHFWRRPEFSEDRRWSWITEEGISGILVLSIEAINTLHGFLSQREFILKARLYSNPYCRFPLNKMSGELLRKVVSRLPTPIESPANALRLMRTNPISSRRIGGFTMKQNCIEMSGVDLLRILSGELSIEEFCRNYNLPSNPFKNALMKFQTIKSVKVEPAADRDDDKVVIEFGMHDSAIGPFRVPEGDKGRGVSH
jgi:hypothetical protein